MLRQRIHDDVCGKGFNAQAGAFVQHYDTTALDASVLLIPLVGFLPPSDPRVISTVAAVEKRLLRDGLVLRYNTADGTDGLKGDEGAFLACSFWLADNLYLLGRRDDARRMFERLLAMRNDVGLLSEEYDLHNKRLIGNFPQAFSHIALINTAHNLSAPDKVAAQRSAGPRR
jgi:GH15 family glucan-1,4-alpha-glucosidase